MVSSGVTKGGMYGSIVDLCAVCILRVKANSILCVQCGKWINGRCAGVKNMSARFSTNLTSRKCEENIGEALEQE